MRSVIREEQSQEVLSCSEDGSKLKRRLGVQRCSVTGMNQTCGGGGEEGYSGVATGMCCAQLRITRVG